MGGACVVGDGVGVRGGVAVDVGVKVGVAVGTAVAVGVGVGVDVGTAVGDGVGVRVGEGMGVASGVGVGVAAMDRTTTVAWLGPVFTYVHTHPMGVSNASSSPVFASRTRQG